MDDTDLYHPDLRSLPALVRQFRASDWGHMFLPAHLAIHWAGDARLYCTVAAYQDVLDRFPCETVGEGNRRRTDPNVMTGERLDAWRLDIERWLGRTRFTQAAND